MVEDNADQNELLSMALRMKGFEAVGVTDGAEALAAVAISLKGEPFDAAVVDIAMRHVDGLAFYKALRCFEANELYSRPMIVKFLSAYPETYEAVEKGKIPRGDYYTKGDGSLRLVADLEALACSRDS